MFSITAAKMQELLNTMLDKKQISTPEHEMMTKLVSSMQPHTFEPGIPPFFNEPRLLFILEHAIVKAKVRKPVLQQLLYLAILSFEEENKDKEKIDLTRSLYFTITHKFHELAHFLLDQNLCMRPGYLLEPGGSSCTLWMLKYNHYNQALFDKIVKRESHINAVETTSRSGEKNALFLAILRGNEYATKAILLHPDISLQFGRFDCRLISYHFVPEIFRALIQEKVQNPDFQLPMPRDRLYEFPLTWLSKANQERLGQFVSNSILTLDVFQNKALREDFERFLNSEVPLPFRNMNRLSIALDCILYLKDPTLIDQNETLLCGVVCVMQHLVMADPVKFIYSVIDMAELDLRQPRTLPKRIKSIPDHVKNFGFHLAELWLQTVRHANNAIFHCDPSSRLAALSSLTRPHNMASMYQDFGFKVRNETTQIRLSPSTWPGRFFDPVRKWVSSYGVLPEALKVYSKHHEEIQCQQARFDDLCARAENIKYLTLLMTNEFLNKMLSVEADTSLLKFVECSHYIILTRFSYDPEENTVSFDFLSLGKCHSGNRIYAEAFKQHFLGLIEVDYDVSKRLIAQEGQLQLERPDQFSGPRK